MCLGLREAQGRQNEGNSECLKNYLHLPFKTKNTHFSQVTFSQSYSQKMHLKHKTFRGLALLAKQSRDNYESFCLNFVFSLFCLNPFSWDELSRVLLAKMPQNEFLMKNMKNTI